MTILFFLDIKAAKKYLGGGRECKTFNDKISNKEVTYSLTQVNGFIVFMIKTLFSFSKEMFCCLKVLKNR